MTTFHSKYNISDTVQIMVGSQSIIGTISAITFSLTAPVYYQIEDNKKSKRLDQYYSIPEEDVRRL